MAIYHLHAKVIQRSKGKNAVAAAAYRRATKLFDEKSQQNFDYTRKKDVIHRELMAPGGGGQWALDLVKLHEAYPRDAAAVLWNRVEFAEKRVDAQLAREFEFSLPIELTPEQNIVLAREFIQDQFVLRGMIADWTLHGDKGNPHVHVMLTMRELTEAGFGKKVVAWNSRALLQEWRAQWAQYANFHLRLHQHATRIDHRSYHEQGIDLIPTVHQGKAITDMARRGIPTDILREAQHLNHENLERIAAKPERLLHKISQQQDTFTQKHLNGELGRYVNNKECFSKEIKGVIASEILNSFARGLEAKESVVDSALIARILETIEYHDSVFDERRMAKAVDSHTDNAELFVRAFLALKVSPELIALGMGDDGQERFTTRRLFALENEVQALADKLACYRSRTVSPQKIVDVLKSYEIGQGKTLTDEQCQALHFIIKGPHIRCLVGRAGTGKSFTLGAAKAVWESCGYHVHGVALSGIAAEGLTKEVGISSRTIESFRYAIKHKTLVLSSKHIVVMDEAGMTDSIAMHAVLHAVQKAHAKLVLVGDPQQLQPVGPGATFRALAEHLGFAEIQTVYRQQLPWQRKATRAFSEGRIGQGLLHYEAQGCLQWYQTSESAQEQLVQNWLALYQSNPSKLDQMIVLAHRNQDVRYLNEKVREAHIKIGKLWEGYTAMTSGGELSICVGERLLFQKNNRVLGVSNGSFGTVTALHVTERGQLRMLTVALDGPHAQVITFNPEQYPDFNYGYAATVHKAQGVTVDHTLVYAGGRGWQRHLTYVAMTRHRQSCQVYADAETHTNVLQLRKQLSRRALKDSVLDYPLSFATHRGVAPESLGKRLSHHIAKRLLRWKTTLKERYEVAMNFLRRWNDSQLSQHADERQTTTAQVRHATQQKKDLAQATASFTGILSQDATLEAILSHYIDKEIELTRLIKLMYSPAAQESNPTLTTLTHKKALQTFAEEAIKHPALQTEFAQVNLLQTKSLAECGGFNAIHTRIQQGKWRKEDIQTALIHLQGRARVQTQSRSQDRERGGWRR